MNLFIAGHGAAPVDVDAARQALADLLADLGFFSPETIETWRSPSEDVAIVVGGHRDGDLGGVRYTSFAGDRAALFAGRPVLWPADGRPDGGAALDAARYHAPIERWARELEGRCTVVRAEGSTLELYVDPLGSYPVYATGPGARVRWFSNNADALRRLVGDRSLDEEALAGILGGGWSLGGHPVWRAVRRVERGTVLRLDRGEAEHRTELLSLEHITSLPGAGLDAARAGEDLVALCGSLADWPGRRNVVPVTGGRDSRLVLAAALRAGFAFDACTGGAPGDPDVEVARRLCGLTGLAHHLLEPDPHGDRLSHLAKAARVTALVSGGTATLADGAGFPLGPRAQTPPIWHSGQGGEIGRAYYGAGGVGSANDLYARFVGRRPGRAEIVSAEATELLRRRIAEFWQGMRDAGAATVDVPDLFYLLERMACWAAPTHGVVELIRDTTSPLWSARLLPHLLGPPAGERALDGFHHQVLSQLSPQLVDQPFQDGSSWPIRQNALARRWRRARETTVKARAELRRRAARQAATRRTAAARASSSPATNASPSAAVPGGPPGDPFDAILAAVREATAAQPQHAAWSVLDRRRVRRLLAAPAVSLDEMSRYYVWRLASVFLAFG